MIKKRFKVTLTLLFHVSLFLGCSAFGFSVCWMKTRGITTGRHAHKRQNTHKSSCTLYTYSYTHYKFTHPAAHPQLPTYLFFFFCSLAYSYLTTLKKNFTEGALPHEHVNVLTVDPVTEESCSAESQLPGDRKDTKPSFDCSYASTLLF